MTVYTLLKLMWAKDEIDVIITTAEDDYDLYDDKADAIPEFLLKARVKEWYPIEGCKLHIYVK